MSFDRLSDILKKVAQRYPALGKRMAEAEAISRWEIAVGAQIAKHAQAVKVVREELWVEVDHPIWRSELHHRKKQILDKMNEGVPEAGQIKDLMLVALSNKSQNR